MTSAPKRIVERFACERGIAMPVAISALAILLTLTVSISVVVVSANDQSRRDRGSMLALAAAESGLDAAVFRLNQVFPPAERCAVKPVPPAPEVPGPPSSAPLTITSVNPDGWCPSQWEVVSGDAPYPLFVYRVSNATVDDTTCQQVAERTIVSQGFGSFWERRPSRTVRGTVRTPAGGLLLKGCSALARDSVKVLRRGSIEGDAASQGDIRLGGRGQIRGDATTGEGRELKDNSILGVAGIVRQGADGEPVTLSKVKLSQVPPLDEVDNYRIPTNPTAMEPGLDPVENPSGFRWNPDTRELILGRKTKLTLGGDVYRFCRLKIARNATLTIARRDAGRSPMRIYIEPPDECAFTKRTRLAFTGKGHIANENLDPTTLVLVGVGELARKNRHLQFSFGGTYESDDSNGLVVYAPGWLVRLHGKAVVVGGVLAKRIVVTGSSRLVWTDDLGRLTIGALRLAPNFTRADWEECSQPVSAPSLRLSDFNFTDTTC